MLRTDKVRNFSKVGDAARCHHPDLSGSKSAKVAAAVATRERQDHNVRLRAKPVQGQVERESRKRIWMYFDEQGTVKRPVTES